MKHLFLILMLFSNSFIILAQIPNAGMEQWNSSPQLVDWQTNSYPQTMPPYDPYIVKQDTNSYIGEYAANFYGNGIMKPYAKITFPITAIHPSTLNLWYKLSFPPCINGENNIDNDTVSVEVDLLQNGNVVDSGYWNSTLSVSDYTQLNIPISQNASVFDSCRIMILGGKIFGGCGFAPASTEFRVDELSLTYNEISCVDSSQIDINAMCPLVFMPVCGCNGVTYNNFCEAENFGGVTQWTDGECGSSQTGSCGANYTYTKSADTVNFNNISSATTFTGYLWTFGDGDSSTYFNPQHIYNQTGWHTVCLTINGTDTFGDPCSDTFCDSIYISDGCIDSSLICPPNGLCCDAPLFEEVCGCNNITYQNSCIATYLGGVLNYTTGPCIVGLNEEANIEKSILVPNPAHGNVSIILNLRQATMISVKIRNTIGQELLSVTSGFYNRGNHSLPLEISSLSQGVYVVEITENNSKSNQLLIIN